MFRISRLIAAALLAAPALVSASTDRYEQNISRTMT